MASRDFFIYTAEFLPIAASSSVTVRVPIQGDSDFELTEITGDVRATDETETVIAAPAALVQIADAGSGRLLFDRPQIWDNIIGTAERPFILPMPKMFSANSVISVALTNNVAAEKKVRISLIGYKHFAE